MDLAILHQWIGVKMSKYSFIQNIIRIIKYLSFDGLKDFCQSIKTWSFYFFIFTIGSRFGEIRVLFSDHALFGISYSFECYLTFTIEILWQCFYFTFEDNEIYLNERLIWMRKEKKNNDKTNKTI